jgi:hypothetical protein
MGGSVRFRRTLGVFCAPWLSVSDRATLLFACQARRTTSLLGCWGFHWIPAAEPTWRHWRGRATPTAFASQRPCGRSVCLSICLCPPDCRLCLSVRLSLCPPDDLIAAFVCVASH